MTLPANTNPLRLPVYVTAGDAHVVMTVMGETRLRLGLPEEAGHTDLDGLLEWVTAERRTCVCRAR